MKKEKKQINKGFLQRDGLWFRIFILIISVLLLYVIFINREELKNLSQYGYLGIFVVNFISASSIFLPLPGTASVFIGGAVWDPVIVGIVSGLGSAFGELFGYFLGYGGRGLIKDFKGKGEWVKKIEKNFHKNGMRTTFIFAILPLPVFDVIGVIAGAVSFPVWKFFLAMVSARIIRNILFAFTGTKLFS